jgi:hypothetical protein
MSKTKQKERGVLITTSHRGVFFGYTSEPDSVLISAKSLFLRATRNCLFWPSEQKGFEGLAVTGPMAECRIGPAADLFLHDITCIALCTENAIKAWEVAPWSR